ncbi:hypothetical protein LEN26_002353 [Aphanomyces euteiches]|nr:hypothetical protein LEN26_002353 [Aphanomyces euteiches]
MVAARGEDVVGSIDEEKSFRGNNIIQAAFQSVECLKNVRELLNRRANVDLANKEGRTALIQATQIGGNSEIVALLVAAKCNVLAVDDKKYSALHYAAAGAQADNVRLLLKAKADVDGKTLDGDSALHKACEAGSFEVAQELLQCNIDIDGENSVCVLPLKQRASQFGSLAIVQELIRRGSDVNKRDHIGMTALQLAVQGSADVDVVKCLVEAKSDIENTCIEEYSAETVLIRAIKSSSEDVVKYLLSKGANIETADKDGQTPLIVASTHKLHNMIEILLDSGASIEASDKVGCTALMRAVINLDKHGAEVLVQRGANVHSQNKLGFSALSLAMYKDIEFGKSLYTTYRKSFPIQTPTNPLEIQRTSSSMESLHIGDMIFLSIDGGTVMGCDGFVQKTLQSTTVDEEWEDHVFCIHPKLSYDHVNMSAVDHPYFQISDPYSEDEREKKRNSLKLSQILNSKELVTSDTVIQLYHVKSQQYLRLNPMAAENESNVCLDHLASFYSWFQFRSDYGNDIYTWSPVSLVSACVPTTSIGAAKTKPVYLVASRVKKTVEIGLHTTYDPLSRQIPLPQSLGLKVKPAKGEILSAFELEKSSDGKSYEIRHVVSRFFLGIECPCSGKEQVVASLVNATLGASVATVSFEIKSSTQAKDHSVDGIETASSMLYRFSHTCAKCGRNWMLSTQQEKVVWNHHGAWFSCSPIEPENVQKMYHVCSWRERYLNLVHDAILFLGKDLNETALRQSIHNVHIVSKQICDLLEARTVDGVGDSLLHICSDIIILEAMFLATSVFRAITSFDEAKEMMVQFFRAMRVLVVGNSSFESYLQDQFEHPIGKIKILSGLDMEFASNYVDARTIMTSMISKNSSSVAYLLEALDTSDNVDSLSWTNKAQFLIALSLTERAHSVTAYKLYDHEIKMTDLWLKNWDTMAVETTLRGDVIWVRWNDCCRGRLLSSTALNRNTVKDIGLANAEVDDSHIALPLQDIVNVLQKKDSTTEAQSYALENWIIIYLHHLKLVSALSLKNTDVRPRFFSLFPPELLIEGACNTFLSFPLRSQYLELFCSLYIPRVSTPEPVQYTSLFLGINEALSINIAILKRLEKLIESSLIDSVNDDPAYFGFIERLLIVMNGLIDIGWYAYEKGKCVQSVTWLYSVGMKWDYITSFEVQRLLDNDPFNLLSRSISGSNIIVTCQRLILPIARKLTRYSIVAKSDDFFFFKAQSGLEDKVKQPIVHYLSSLLTHSDTLAAQEAFLNLFELLPDHSFDWLRVDKPLCAHLKKSDNVLLRQLFAEANSIFGSGVHVIRGSIEIKHKADGKKKKVNKPPTQQLQDAALIVKKWRMDAPTNFLLLRLAHIPERIIGYIQDCLAQNVFVVPPNDVLAAECRYYLTTVPPFDLGDNELLYLYRQSKEKIVEDRIHLVILFFDMMKLLAPFLSEDLSLSLLKLMLAWYYFYCGSRIQ